MFKLLNITLFLIAANTMFALVLPEPKTAAQIKLEFCTKQSETYDDLNEQQQHYALLTCK